MIFQDLTPGTFDPGNFAIFEVSVDQNLDIKAYVLDDDNLKAWTHNLQAQRAGARAGGLPVVEMYTSMTLQWGMLSFKPQGPGAYHLVLDNTYSTLTPKRVVLTAYRLQVTPEEMRKTYARESGGMAGSHPTNIMDHAYALPGAINTCGDSIIILSQDGPSLGGYTCPFSVIYADMWKVGQGAPARDFIKFTCVTLEEALEARIEQDKLFTEQAIQVRR